MPKKKGKKIPLTSLTHVMASKLKHSYSSPWNNGLNHAEENLRTMTRRVGDVMAVGGRQRVLKITKKIVTTHSNKFVFEMHFEHGGGTGIVFANLTREKSGGIKSSNWRIHHKNPTWMKIVKDYGFLK